MEIKTEEDPAPAGDKPQENQETEQKHEGGDAAPAEEVKVESDRGREHSRKRPYEESRSYGYYEHREDKRYVHHQLGYFKSWLPAGVMNYHKCTLESKAE